MVRVELYKLFKRKLVWVVLLGILILIAVTVFYHNSYYFKNYGELQETLLCAKRGRKECVQAKTAGAFLVTNALYLYSIVLPCLVYFLVHRGNGMETSIQMTPWLRESQLNMNYITLFFHTIFLSFIVIHIILIITLIVSYYVKSPMTAMCIVLGMLYLLRPDFMSVSLNSEIANKITALTPVNAVDTVNLAKQLPVGIGGMTVQWLTVAEIMYSVLLVSVSIFFFLVIGKRQKCE